MDGKKNSSSKSVIAKYGLPVLIAIFFIISLLTTPQTAQDGIEAGSSSGAAAVVETIAESSADGRGTTSVSEMVTASAGTAADTSLDTTVATEVGASQTEISEPAADAQNGLAAVNGENIIAPDSQQQASLEKAEATVDEDGEYTSMTEVAAYIHLYGKLPSNFISKTKAKNQGWIQSEGNLQDVLPGKSIGGSRFYNDEGILPEEDGREYTECDIDYNGGKRNAKRIVFSNDGLVFYTEDHYETYIQLY